MTKHELLPGLHVDVKHTVHEYCEVDRNAYLYFDSIEVGTDPNDLQPSDIWIANNLNGRIQLAEFAAIWGRVEEHRAPIREALSAIPFDASLTTASSHVLTNAGALLDILCGPRAYASRITKILHKKRPDLFPIIDARVRPLFDAAVPPVKGRSWPDYMVEMGRVIGPWVQRNAAALDGGRAPFSGTTRLRAYDICLWKHAA